MFVQDRRCSDERDWSQAPGPMRKLGLSDGD